MIRTFAASSLHHAIETVNLEDQKALNEKVYSIYSGPEFEHYRKKILVQLYKT